MVHLIFHGIDEQSFPNHIIMARSRFSLGRSRGCEIRLPHEHISNHHLTFVRREGYYLVADMGSTNGTQLDDYNLMAMQYVPIRNNAVITIGKIRIALHYALDIPNDLETNDISSAEFDDLLLQGHGTNDSSPYFEQINRSGKGTRLPLIASYTKVSAIRLQSEELSIGTIEVNTPHQDHDAIIRFHNERFELVPLKKSLKISLNGCLINEPIALKQGDILSYRKTKYRYDDPLHAALAVLDDIIPPEVGENDHSVEEEYDSNTALKAAAAHHLSARTRWTAGMRITFAIAITTSAIGLSILIYLFI